MLVEGVHFTREAMSLEDAGWRAMAANFSDLAAMGARPVLATVALGVAQEDARSAMRWSSIGASREPRAALRHRHRRRRPLAQRGDDDRDRRRRRGAALERQDARGRHAAATCSRLPARSAPRGPGSNARARRPALAKRRCALSPPAGSPARKGAFLAASANVTRDDGLLRRAFDRPRSPLCGERLRRGDRKRAGRGGGARLRAARARMPERFALAGGEDFELLAAIRPRAFGTWPGASRERSGARCCASAC